MRWEMNIAGAPPYVCKWESTHRGNFNSFTSLRYIDNGVAVVANGEGAIDSINKCTSDATTLEHSTQHLTHSLTGLVIRLESLTLQLLRQPLVFNFIHCHLLK